MAPKAPATPTDSAQAPAPEAGALRLPLAVVNRVDVSRLHREVAALSEYMDQAALRKTGAAMQLPRTSRLLEVLAQENKLNLLQEPHRKLLEEFLKKVKETAPQVQISFATDPNAAFMQKITEWFRREVHPQILVQTGLQPSIAAGCTVRTPNKYYDFSLRAFFAKNRELLLQKITELSVATKEGQQ